MKGDEGGGTYGQSAWCEPLLLMLMMDVVVVEILVGGVGGVVVGWLMGGWIDVAKRM